MVLYNCGCEVKDQHIVTLVFLSSSSSRLFFFRLEIKLLIRKNKKIDLHSTARKVGCTHGKRNSSSNPQQCGNVTLSSPPWWRPRRPRRLSPVISNFYSTPPSFFLLLFFLFTIFLFGYYLIALHHNCCAPVGWSFLFLPSSFYSSIVIVI